MDILENIFNIWVGNSQSINHKVKINGFDSRKIKFHAMKNTIDKINK